MTRSLNMGYKVLNDLSPYIAVISTPHHPPNPPAPHFLCPRHFELHRDPSTPLLTLLPLQTPFLICGAPFHTLKPYINVTSLYSHVHHLPKLYIHSFPGLPGQICILCYSLHYIYYNH